ncbi:tetratricopeptide repeat protein [Okeania sp. KiyG1]|uniref:tetratricopeptide repeat protein n=1 Tax=Okeania sp. KiyG1 TaxID=2720165 RepID=UPI001923A779|nr:tetratricopeptide repeat protein [Okeania sp. KiyG1]GGA09044.1 hypothetical protein CYANOKiyG1_21830 [Okeania sp. KiyG1]
MKSIIYYEKRLFIIPVVGRRLDDMPKLQNNLFRGKPQQRIGLLEELSAQRLITNPLEEFLKNHQEVSLKYNEAAIKEIIKLSAGHPYFTQGICYSLFVEARYQEKTEILPEDVNQVIDPTIELLEPGLIPFRNGLPILERIVFSAAATAQERAKQKNQSSVQNPLELLKEFGVDVEHGNVEHGNLHQASKNLIENKFLDEDGYKVTIKFVRHWLVKYHPIQSSIWEFEKLDPNASDYYEKANIWRNKRQTDDELYHYEKALELNPNHFSALFSLAELYLNKAELHLERTKSYPKENKDELYLIREDFLQALKLYERAYKVDSERAQDEYIKSLMGAIKLYLEDHNFPEASKLYRRFLQVNPERIKDEYINLSVDLAKSHLKDKKFKEALEFYELAYNVNPERVKDGYIKLLLEATKLHLEEHKFQEASELYERYREVNPENAEDEYINLLVGLANSHLKNQEFEEELKLYELAYKVNSESVKAEYTESLVRYGDYLIKNRDLTNRDVIAEVRIFPEKILDIDSTNRKAKLQLTLLDRKEDNLREQEENREINSQIELYKKRRNIINFSAILISFMLIVISFFLGLKFRPAPSSQPEPVLSDNEKKKRFSSGEGTIFDENNQGIFKCNQKFQKKKYSEAAECFGQLVKNDSDEPEALIYYNNSLSRQSTNRQVLAVIVPADRDEKSKEMLRGVAQAQHKFNSNESFSTKPLEILIVDSSSNDPETSLKVAREIVKDTSILGVVGNTSKKALEVYEEESLAMISPTSTNTELSEILFITIDNEILSEKLAEYVKQLDVEKVIIFYDSKSLSSERIKKILNIT